MSKKIKVILPVSLLLLLIGGLLIGLLTYQQPFFYTGTLEATKSDLPARIHTIVKEKLVKEGESVKAGQTLYLLDEEEFKIAASAAKRDYERADKLYKQGSLPLENYEHLKTKRDQTALYLEWCRLTAPSAGTILGTYKEVGEWVAPGMKLLTLANLEEIWALIYVEQPKIFSLKLNQPVTGLLPELPTKNFLGKITWIGSEAEFTPKNVQTRTERTRLVFPVKITFNNQEQLLKPGMTIELKL